jgi:hypothetical protein
MLTKNRNKLSPCLSWMKLRPNAQFDVADIARGRGEASAKIGYIERRYCPPTSNSAWVIWPSEHTRTASISTANTFSSAITA